MHIQEVKLAMEHNLKAQGAGMADFAIGNSAGLSIGVSSEKSGGTIGLFKNQLTAETLKLGKSGEKPFERPVEKPYEKPAEYKAEKTSSAKSDTNSNAKSSERLNEKSYIRENDATKTEAENSPNRQTVNSVNEKSDTENADKSLAALEASGVAAAIFQTNIDAFDEAAAGAENLLQNLFAESESYAQFADADLMQTSFEDDRSNSDEFDAFFEKLSLSMLTEEKETEDTEKNPMLEFIGLDELRSDAKNLAFDTSPNAEGEAEAAVALENDALANLIGNNDDSLINVTDERTITSESALRSAKSSKDGEGFVEGVSSGSDNVALGADGHGKSASSSLGVDGQNHQKENKFSSMLSREIQNKAGDFVKAGNIVMRDNNQGVIRLALNPGSLGDVKINLRLNGNEISANIAVASEEAFLAFKDSIASIKAAFSESGFGTGDFNLSWTGGGQGQEQGSGKNREAFSGEAALTYIDSTPDAVQSDEAFYNAGVNLVA